MKLWRLDPCNESCSGRSQAQRRRPCPSLSNRCWEIGRGTAATFTGMMAHLQDSCSVAKKTIRMPFVSPGLGSLRGMLEAWTEKTSVSGSGGEVWWRRSECFVDQSPGCRQGTILAPVTARHYCPAAGLLGLGTFILDRRRDHSVAARSATRPKVG
jgi:hypothetical protein